MHTKVSEIIFENFVEVTKNRTRESDYWGCMGVRNNSGMATAKNK